MFFVSYLQTAIWKKTPINPYNPKISLVILLNDFHTVPMILVLRICYWIN